MRGKKRGDFAPPWRWGIFLRTQCAGLDLDRQKPDFEPMHAIYRALKNRGFRETYWQFVYPGQIGGLIRSVGAGRFEYHVRFFRGGMIYAEFEAGRSALLHFFVRRCYLNEYIASRIKSDISEADYSYFLNATARYKEYSQKNWIEWGARDKLMNPAIKKAMKYFSCASDWRVLFVAMLASASAYYIRDTVYIPLLAVLLIAIFLIAPKRY